uniref:Uncharacterized protein n=1 Tax=Salmonella phage PMBT18 TaxID=3229742 RepID=A0AB39C080_9CAUD
MLTRPSSASVARDAYPRLPMFTRYPVSPPHHRFAGTYASGLVLSVFF